MAVPCWSCGASYADPPRFCTQCGTPMTAPEDTIKVPPPAPWMAQDDTIRGVPRMPSEPPRPLFAPMPPVMPAPIQKEPQRRRSIVLPLVLVAVVVLALLGAGVGYLIATGDEDTPNAAVGDGADEQSRDSDDASAAPSAVPPASTEPTPTPQGAPAIPVAIEDNQGETQKDNGGPRVRSSADIKRVRFVPAQATGPGWVFVDFYGQSSPAVAVIVRFDVDGDQRPEFVTWRHLSNGASGSGPVQSWGHGRETIEGSQQDDARFQTAGYVAPAGGVSFPVDLTAAEIPAGTVRVNVQVISDASYYDYAPHRQVWSDPIVFRAAS